WRCFGDMEMRWAMAICEAQEAEHELEMSAEANATLFDREPDFWSERAATDPYWPPPEVDPFENCGGADA
ncbi:MAG: hypothetical protein ACWGPR_11595, partial [Candidatus Deferrimicrobiaceae bacterium]